MITLAPPTRNKPYRILFEHKPRYLYVMIQCETSNYAIAKKYWGEILAIQEHRGYDRVLIEKDVTNPMPMSDVVLLVSELANSGCHDVKFAVYDHNYNLERSGFEEMASNSRGLKLRVCNSMAEAENWLTTEMFTVAVPASGSANRVAA